MTKSKVIDICSDSDDDIMSEASDNYSKDDNNSSEDSDYKESEDEEDEEYEEYEDNEEDVENVEEFPTNYGINKRRIEFNEKLNSITYKERIVNIEYLIKIAKQKMKEYIEELKNYDEYIKVQKDSKYEYKDHRKTYAHIESNKIKEHTTRYGRTIKTVNKLELKEKVNDNDNNTNIVNKKQSFAYFGNIDSLKECSHIESSHIIPDKQQVTIYEKYEIPSEIYYMTSGDIIVKTSPDVHKYMELNINMCPDFSIDTYGKYYVFTQSKYVIDR
jgi:hypothetical protein